jgi:hypothetical protein
VELLTERIDVSRRIENQENQDRDRSQDKKSNAQLSK